MLGPHTFRRQGGEPLWILDHVDCYGKIAETSITSDRKRGTSG